MLFSFAISTSNRAIGIRTRSSMFNHQLSRYHTDYRLLHSNILFFRVEWIQNSQSTQLTNCEIVMIFKKNSFLECVYQLEPKPIHCKRIKLLLDLKITCRLYAMTLYLCEYRRAFCILIDFPVMFSKVVLE